jgi:hypothetical protein
MMVSKLAVAAELGFDLPRAEASKPQHLTWNQIWALQKEINRLMNDFREFMTWLP